MPKTVLNDRNLYEKRNKDDIFIRDVIGGLLKLLNNRLVYTQVWEDSSEGVVVAVKKLRNDVADIAA